MRRSPPPNAVMWLSERPVFGVGVSAPAVGGRPAAERLEEHLDGIHHDPEVGVNRRLIRLFFSS
jgi:hypothetical protein